MLDFILISGTTYSGYAYSFTADQEDIHIMRKWEGDDPGINNQKTPTVLLLTPEPNEVWAVVHNVPAGGLRGAAVPALP